MGRLIYSLTTSIDGYVSDKDGNFAWTQPSEEVLACVNGNLQNVGTFLLGRSMYETLAVWDTLPTDGQSEGMNDFAMIWRAANKIVYSTSLSAVATADTTIERVFHAEAIHKIVSASAKDFNIGGPHLAAEAIKAGIIDEYHQFIVPLILERVQEGCSSGATPLGILPDRFRDISQPPDHQTKHRQAYHTFTTAR